MPPALTFNSFCFLHLILMQKQTGFISTMNGACKVPAIPVWSSHGHSQLYSLCSPPYLSSPGTVPEKNLHSLSNEGGRSRQHTSSSSSFLLKTQKNSLELGQAGRSQEDKTSTEDAREKEGAGSRSYYSGSKSFTVEILLVKKINCNLSRIQS